MRCGGSVGGRWRVSLLWDNLPNFQLSGYLDLVSLATAGET